MAPRYTGYFAANGLTAQAGPAALAPLYAAFAARTTGPKRIVFAGSSTTAGQNASIEAHRYVNRLVTAMQAAYPSGLGSESTVATSNAASFGTLTTAPGIHGYNVGEGSTTSATYLTSAERASIAGLSPVAIIHMVGSNDFRAGMAVATYKSNVQAAITHLAGLISTPCVHVLVHSYARYDTFTPVAPWSAYGQALAEIAAADPDRVAFIDLSVFYPPVGVPGTDPLDLMNPDAVHQDDAGHAYMAELLRRALDIPAGAASASGDVNAPTTPTGLAASAGDSQVALTWNPATDDTAVTSYRVYRNGTLIGSPGSPQWVDAGRTNGVQYSYTVAAADAAANISAQSAAVTATPTVSPDTTPPSVPTGLTGTTTAGTQIALIWNPSVDNNGVTGYKVRRAGSVVGSPAGASFTDTGLTSGTSYSYTVAAFDAAGNESAETGSITVTAGRVTSDSFTGSDMTSIPGRTTDIALGGVAKTWVGDVNALALTSSRAVPAAAPPAVYFAGFAEPVAVLEWSATIVALPTGSALNMDVHRVAAVGAGTPDTLRAVIGTDGGVTLTRRVSGVSVALTSAVTFAAGDRIAVRWTAGNLELRKNGALVSSATPGALASPGFCGFSASNTATGFIVDDVALDLAN